MPDPKKPTMFPRDCPRDCPHFRSWDMSIDDWTCECDLMDLRIDECDMDFRKARCPLDNASDLLSVICDDYGLTPLGIKFALAQYQKVIFEITNGLLSKLTYKADYILETAQERWCETCDIKEELEPRVLTLEEVLGGDECWFEYINGSRGYADVYMQDNKTAIIHRTNIRPVEVPITDYMKKWRCWSYRPTDEQRKAVKWDK